MLGNIAANRTHLRCIGRIDKYNRDASKSGFVKYLLSQVVKRPATLIASSPYPFTDILEVFKSDAASGAFRNLYKLLADLVIYVVGKAFLFAGKLFGSAPGRFCAFLLQSPALSAPAFPDRINFTSCELFSIGRCGDIGNAQINTKIFLDIIRFWFVNIASCEKIEDTVNQNQVAFAPLRFEQVNLPLSGKEWNCLSSLNCPDAHSLLVDFPGQNTLVVSKAAGRSKNALDFLVQLIGVSNFSDSPDSHLCGKNVARANISVNNVVNIKLLESLSFPGLPANIVAGSISRLEGQ